MTDEQAKAVQELAKTTGKALESAGGFGGFIAELTKGPLSEISGFIEDKLKYRRWENQQNLMLKAKRRLRELGGGHVVRPLPLKLVFPLLEAASLEEDDELQEKWASLLVNAVAGPAEKELHRVYIDILERLSPYEARILSTIYSLPYEACQHQHIRTDLLPDRAEINHPEPSNKPENPPEPSNDVRFALLNLDRLNCVSICRSMGGGQIFGFINQTLLGSKFVNACSPS